MRHLRLVLPLLLLVTSLAWAGSSGDGGNLKVQGGKIFVSGTSGGVPYFSATDTLGTSAALTQFLLVTGGGAGAAPSTPVAIGSSGNVLKSGGAGANPAFGTVDLSASSNIGTSILPLADGGTNAAITAANGQVFYSTATAGALTTSGSTGQCLKFNSGSAPTWAACGGSVPLLAFGTGGEITQSTTVWSSPGAGSDISEARVQMVVANAATFNNLKCVSSVLPGASQTYTTTQTQGVCTGALAASLNQVCAIDNSTRIGCTTPATTSEAVSAGQCVAWKVVSSATAATGVVTCTVERTA